MPARRTVRSSARRGAFHPRPLETRDGLVRALRNNSRFRANLARHFRVPESEVVDYVEQNVRLFRLPREVRTQVYGVDASGRSFPVMQRLPKGTLVFGLPDGTVLLKEICGNPMVAHLPPLPHELPPPPVAVKPPVPAQTALAPVPAEPLPAMPEFIPGPIVVPPAGPEVDAPTFHVVAAPPELMPSLDATPGVPQVRARGSGFPWPVLAAIPFIIGGGGGSGGGGQIGGGVVPPPPPPVVPEGNSLAMLAMGALPLIWLRRRRR